MNRFLNHDRHFVSKRWGWEDWLVNGELYCGKILFFKRGKKCSWHYHNKKDETFYVQSGQLNVWYSYDDCLKYREETVDAEQTIKVAELDYEATDYVCLIPGDTFYVPPGMRHQMLGVADTYMFEFSTQHFEEDSIRVVKGD